MYNFAALPTKNWVTDYGFRKALNSYRSLLGDYYQIDKSDKSLLDLVQYQDEGAREQTLKYFDLPEDTDAFLKWVFAWAAYQDELPDGVSQDDIFPYAKLYALYQNETRKRFKRISNVNVYQNRITEASSGQLLISLD